MSYMIRRVFVVFVCACIALAIGRVALSDPQGGFDWAKEKASQVATWAQGVGKSAEEKVKEAPDLPIVVPSASPSPQEGKSRQPADKKKQKSANSSSPSATP